MRVWLANPRGFCAGVDRAIEIVERALSVFSPPVYVRHEVVHNRFVVERLRRRGAVFVDALNEVPDGALVIFSAHGVSRAVQEEARRRGLRVLDATCPLVTKVHLEVIRHNRAGREVILIGHAGHPEVEGTMGQYDPERGPGIHLVETIQDARAVRVQHPDRLAYVTQTTLSVDDTRAIVAVLRQRFPAIQGPRKDDICYATQNRQDAVKRLAARCQVVLVVGSPASSNSNRLVEIARKAGRPAHLVEGPAGIQSAWLAGVRDIGVTAGASAPEVLVEAVVARLKELGAREVQELVGAEERVVFPLPRELRAKVRP